MAGGSSKVVLKALDQPCKLFGVFGEMSRELREML
jgi:hypothetical protein